MRKLAALLIVILLILTFANCREGVPIAAGTPELSAPVTPAISATPEAVRVGVSLPEEAVGYLAKDADMITELLEAKGYTVDIQYAERDVDTQISQIEAMMDAGCKVLIIDAIDGVTLEDVLAEAKAAGVTIIAYDRLICYTQDVDYYVTFDWAGKAQGRYIEDALGLKDSKGPFNFEIFTGDLNDGNVGIYYYGAMDILQPYIDNGQLVVPSGQIEIQYVGTKDYTAENAQTRMASILATYYTSEKLDVVLSPIDDISQGIVRALKDAGYGTDEKPYPVLTGLDCEIESVRLILEGSQSMSVFRDRYILMAKVAEMVVAALTGGEVPVNDAYDNGVKQVPTFVCEPAVLTKDNIREYLIDGGYYTEADIDG